MAPEHTGIIFCKQLDPVTHSAINILFPFDCMNVIIDVYRDYDPKYPTWNQTGRGITAVPAEDGSGKEVILIGIEDPPEAVIVRIEPHHDHKAVVELNYHDYCRDAIFGRERASTRTMAVMHYVDGMTLEEVAGHRRREARRDGRRAPLHGGL